LNSHEEESDDLDTACDRKKEEGALKRRSFKCGREISLKNVQILSDRVLE